MRVGTKQVTAFKRGVNRKLVEGGYCVTLSVMDCGDGMYQEIVHPAVFKTPEQAEHLLARVSKNLSKINLNNWLVGNHPCDAYQRKPENNPLMYCPLPAWQ